MRCFIAAVLVIILSLHEAEAHHEDVGVLNANWPTLTMGAPLAVDNVLDERNDTYSGLRFTIPDHAPDAFRFNTGEALWIGEPQLQVVDTPTEQSFFTVDPNVGFALPRNRPDLVDPSFSCCIGPWGLQLGDLLPVEFVGFGFAPHPWVGEFLSVEYRLPGGLQVFPGAIARDVIIPEPTTVKLLFFVLPAMLIHRRGGRSGITDSRH